MKSAANSRVTTQHFPSIRSVAMSLIKLAEEDHATTMIALIEAWLGIDNVDAIAAVDGVDCLYLGHVVDLASISECRALTTHDCLMQRMRCTGMQKPWKIVHLGSWCARRVGRNGAARGSNCDVWIGHWHSARCRCHIGC